MEASIVELRVELAATRDGQIPEAGDVGASAFRCVDVQVNKKSEETFHPQAPRNFSRSILRARRTQPPLKLPEIAMRGMSAGSRTRPLKVKLSTSTSARPRCTTTLDQAPTKRTATEVTD